MIECRIVIFPLAVHSTPWRSWQRRIKGLINCWSWRSFLTINAINVPSGHVFRPAVSVSSCGIPRTYVLYSVNFQPVCLRPVDPFCLSTVPRDEAASWQANRHRHKASVLHRQAGQALDYGQQALRINGVQEYYGVLVRTPEYIACIDAWLKEAEELPCLGSWIIM